MPLEVYGRELNKNVEFDNFLVEPGEGRFLRTYINNEQQVIGISCDYFDQGAVKIYPAEGGFTDPDTEFVDYDELPEAMEVIHIDSSHPHEHLMIPEDRGKYLLGIRAVSSLAITASNLIPLGLIYPDMRPPIDRIGHNR